MGLCSEVLSECPSGQIFFDQWSNLFPLALEKSKIYMISSGRSVEAFAVPPGWRVVKDRRCVGRRDVGNFQSVPFAECLERCKKHSFCVSATTWPHGEEVRCYLSSSCTKGLSIEEKDAILFEKLTHDKHVLPVHIDHLPSKWSQLTAAASWPPRTGQSCTSTPDGRFWLLGGHGVRPLGISAPANLTGNKSGEEKIYDPTIPYHGRHVELDGRMVPLRSLDYGRLPDIWYSADFGQNWKLAGFAGFGARSYFGVVVVRDELFVLGGVEEVNNVTSVHRNDVWRSVNGKDWTQLANSTWSPRCSFATVSFPDSSLFLMLGGRRSDGLLLSEVWQGNVGNYDPARPDVNRVKWDRLADAPWSARSDLVAVYGLDSVWVLGGRSSRGYEGNVWRSAPPFNKWIQQVSASPWQGSVGMTAVFLPLKRQIDSLALEDTLVVLGGYGTLRGHQSDKPVEGMWALTDVNGVWKSIHSLPEVTPRGHMCALSKGQNEVVMFGGLTKDGYYSNDVWQIEVAPIAAQAEKKPTPKSQKAKASIPKHETTAAIMPMLLLLLGVQLTVALTVFGVYFTCIKRRLVLGPSLFIASIALTIPLAKHASLLLVQPAHTATAAAPPATLDFEKVLSENLQHLYTKIGVMHGEKSRPSGLYAGMGGFDHLGGGFEGGNGAQSIFCRTPICSRDPSCSWNATRSINITRGTMCCNDLLFLMLEDLTAWFTNHDIPYYLMYGTLLGAVRDNDILPHTRDVDVVVPKEYWSLFQRKLSMHKFQGGRSYQFGVDPWEDKVGRMCADYDGFGSASLFGGDDFGMEAKVEYHFDVYSEDWWQVEELQLEDCIHPLG